MQEDPSKGNISHITSVGQYFHIELCRIENLAVDIFLNLS